jgi:hypothetical protein
MPKTLAEVHDETMERLREKPEIVTGRREKIAALRKRIDESKVLVFPRCPQLRRRQNCWFSTDQSDSKKKTKVVKVQVMGVDVGRVKLDAKSNSWTFSPDENKFPDLVDRKWNWSHDPKDAKKIRTFLKEQCFAHAKAKRDSEREIQWVLANDLGSTTHEALRWLQPVTLKNHFTEFGVAITESGKASTGNIDLMVRRGKGAKRGFLVFELKEPESIDVEKALQQAIRYATTLEYEANKDGSDSNNLENYHIVFGSAGKGPLQVGAVVVMEMKVAKIAKELLEQYWSDHGRSLIDRLGFLLYEFKNDKVVSWQWLKDWDAR